MQTERLTPKEFHKQVNSGQRVFRSEPKENAQKRCDQRNKAARYEPSDEELDEHEEYLSAQPFISRPFARGGDEPLVVMQIWNTLAKLGRIYKVNHGRFCSLELWDSFPEDRKTQETLQH